MLRMILLCAFIFSLSICAYGEKSADKGNSVPKFKFSKEEIKLARREYRKKRHEILIALMLNKSGEVVRSRVMQWDKRKLTRRSAEKFRVAYASHIYPSAKDSDPEYRQYLKSTNINSGFSWADE